MTAEGADSHVPDARVAAGWLAGRGPAMLVEVVRAQGSVPRGAGARMLVSACYTAGSIGGGHLELKAISLARERLRAGTAETLEWRVALGPSLGQCCGGVVDLRAQPLTAALVQAWPVARCRFRLHLFGAGHVGRALVNVLANLPCDITWIDERASEFPCGPMPPRVQQVCAEPVSAEVDRGRAGDFYLVLTHSHALDLELTEAILERGDFGWFGLIGSASKRARFEHRLRDRGVTPERLARMTCPIGLPGVRGKEPGVIAVAVAAQLLAVSENH